MNKNSLKHILELIAEGYKFQIETQEEVEGAVTYVIVENPTFDPTNGDFVNYVARLREI
jgi:hypothetical protein